MSLFDILDIFNPLSILTPNGGAGTRYSPAMWLNNMGLSNKTATNTRTSTGTVFDPEGLVVTTEPGEISIEGARRERNIATSLTTHSITVESGRTYQISCEGDNASTVVLSGAATGTLTNDGSDRQAFNTAKTATTTTLALTVAGALTALQAQDVTGRANTAPSDNILAATDYGYGVPGVKYYNTTNGNTVVNNGLVETEGADIPLAPAPQVSMQPARTNLFIRSSEMDDVAWTKTAISTSPGQSGFAGYSESVSLVPTAASSSHWFSQYIAATSDEEYSFSLIVKPAGYDVFQVTGSNGFNTSYTNYILSGEGSVGSKTASTQKSTITALADGSYFIEHTDVATATGQARALFSVLQSDVAARLPAYSGDGVSGVWIAHAGVDEGSTATSPIKTTTAPVTRDNDLIEVADFSNWAPTTSGIMLFAFTPSGDWAALGAEQLVYGGASANLLFRSANDDGLKATDGTSTPSILGGHTPGTEVIASVYFDASINIFQIGYYEMDNATQHWDASPATFTTLTVDPELIIAKILDGAVTIRGLQIFNGMPPSGVDQASIEAWVEATQEAKINERQS